MDELQKLSLQLADVDKRLTLQADYEKTLLLLAAVKANKVFIDEFELVPGGWRLVAPGQVTFNVDVPADTPASAPAARRAECAAIPPGTIPLPEGWEPEGVPEASGSVPEASE